MEDRELTKQIIGYAMTVHSTLGPGFVESVYKKSLFHELNKAGLRAVCEKPLTVYYDDVIVGEFCCDMIVEERILVELKANQGLVAAHEVQLVNYLTATKIETGLLLNFGGLSLDFKRKSRSYVPKKPPQDFTL